MKKLIYIFILAFLGCSSNTSLIKLKIEKEVGHTVKNGIIVLISENNCISCFKDNLYTWIDYADTTNLKITSLFFSGKEFPVEFKRLMSETNRYITWKNTKSLDIFEFLSKTIDQKSPFIILIKNNDVEYLNHLVPVEYYINIEKK